MLEDRKLTTQLHENIKVNQEFELDVLQIGYNFVILKDAKGTTIKIATGNRNIQIARVDRQEVGAYGYLSIINENQLVIKSKVGSMRKCNEDKRCYA